MLTVEPVVGETKQRGGAWETHALFRDGAAVGRIALFPSNRLRATPPSLVDIDGSRYEGRIVDRGKPRWTWVPARWILCRDGSERHRAERRGARDFEVETPETAQPLRFSRPRWRLDFTLAAADGTLWASATLVRRRLLPALRLAHYQLNFAHDLPLSFQVFLAWIIVQDAIDERD